ncbi:hypothetical protein Q4548_15140 [Wenyingzhuangia sp. 2_MG-2023]|nr:hypothetical protein [Wenyingzhuangia sp. 2_MG-2023]
MNKLKNCFNYLLLFVNFIILLDFFLPKKIKEEKIIAISTKKQNYHNAARNFHLTHKVKTANYHFYVSDDFKSTTTIGQSVALKISPIFQKTHVYKNLATQTQGMYSLRLFSGFIFPIFSIPITICNIYDKLKTIALIMVPILFIDLIYLLFY